jgi:hypothetical protein
MATHEATFLKRQRVSQAIWAQCQARIEDAIAAGHRALDAHWSPTRTKETTHVPTD